MSREVHTINNGIYIFHTSVAGRGSIFLNIVEAKSGDRTSVLLNTNQIVASTVGRTFDNTVKNSNKVIKRMTDEVLKPVLKNKKKLKTRNSPAQKQRGGAGEEEANTNGHVSG